MEVEMTEAELDTPMQVQVLPQSACNVILVYNIQKAKLGRGRVGLCE